MTPVATLALPIDVTSSLSASPGRKLLICLIRSLWADGYASTTKPTTENASAINGKNDRKPKYVTEAASRSPRSDW